MVGGPLQNVTQESVQEFQIATNRFTAESGRSASSVINVVTKSGTDRLHGSASFFARDSAWQGLPATFDRSTGDAPPFDREQLAGSAGGPLAAANASGSAQSSTAIRMARCSSARATSPTRTIRRTFAAAPLDDFLGSGRVDWRPSDGDALMVRYAGEQATDTGASTLDRAIGSASQRQRSRNTYNSIVGTWTRVVGPTLVNAATRVVQHVRQRDRAGRARAAADVSQHPGRIVLPRAAGHDAEAVSVRGHASAWSAARTACAPAASGSGSDALFDLGVFQDGRIELVEDFATFDHNGDGRVDDEDLLFAVTLRSGKPDQALVLPDADNNYIALFVQDDWRLRSDLTLNLGLRYELDTDVKNVSRVDEINPIVQPFLHGTRHADRNNLGPRIGFNWAPGDARTSVHGGYGIYYDRITLEIESLERGLDGRALPIEVRAGNTFFLDPATGHASRRSRRRWPTRSPASSFRAPARRASTSSTTACRTRACSSSTSASSGSCRRTSCCGWTASTISARTSSSAARSGVVFNPVVGGPDRVVNLESSVNNHYDALLLSAERRGGASRVPRVVHAEQGAQLRERRSDPVQQRTDRSQQPAARIRPDAKRSAASLHAGRRGDMRPAVSSWRRS